MTTETFVIQSTTDLGQKVEKHYRDTVLVNFRVTKTQLLEQIELNPRHALEWITEEMLVRQATNEIWQRTVAIVRQAATEDQAKRAVLDHIAEVAKHILRFPPRHNSTSEVSNLQTSCETQARCDFVQQASEIVGDFTFIS